MISFARGLAVSLAVACFGSAATAAPEDDYVVLMTALEIDRTCPSLKYMETTYTRGAASEYLSNTTQYRMSQDGRLPQADYDAWFAGLTQTIASNAASVGCTQAALQYILPAKAKAAEAIYQGLALAFHFHAAVNVLEHVPLDDHMVRTASGYETYLRQLYGENFDAFAARMREFAAQELPQQEANPFADLYGLGGIMDPAASEANWNAQSIARSAMNAVQFEVTAEANGYLVRPQALTETWWVPALQRPGATEGLTLVKEPGYQLIRNSERGVDQLYSVIVLLPDRRMRIMFYGETATRLEQPTVRLYVRTEPPPPGANSWSLFDIPGFRNGATAYDAVLADGECLGAPCYDLPAAATEAMLADLEGYFSELFIDYAANAEPEPITATSIGRERFGNAILWKLLNPASAVE